MAVTERTIVLEKNTQNFEHLEPGHAKRLDILVTFGTSYLLALFPCNTRLVEWADCHGINQWVDGNGTDKSSSSR